MGWDLALEWIGAHPRPIRDQTSIVTVMARQCLTYGCLYPAVAGRSRCSRCGPSNPARHGPNPYGYDHQQRRKELIATGQGCVYRYRGGCHGPLHLDHIIPISMGGTHSPDNQQLLCERHNISKGGRNRLR